MDCASFLWVLFGDILGHGGTHVDDEYIGRHCAIPNQFSAFRRLQVAWAPYMASRVCWVSHPIIYMSPPLPE
jgi:hypothetical protein